jgi:rod shape determining protein RodA
MSSFFYKQIIAAGIGFGAILIITFLPERWITNNAYILYGLSIASLILVQFVGVEVHGTRGWIRFGGLSLQPAEIAKLGTLLAIARHLSLKGTDIRTIRDSAIIFVMVALPVYLIIRQPDFGSATVLVAMLLGILLWSGFDIFAIYFVVSIPVIMFLSLIGQIYQVVTVSVLSVCSFFFRKKLVITIGAIAVFVAIGFIAPIIYNNLMDHQKSRIQTFLNPEANPRGTGYNVIQSLLAVGSGGLTGKGFLQGTQTQLRYIPMQWTDFIFSVPTEEFGFIGGALVVGLLAALIHRSISIASEVDDKFYSIVAIGAGSIFLYHTIINIGMAIGLMPVMGIPLPFLSYGGTSLIMNLSLVGLLLRGYRQNKYKKRNL